jgi:hypothetical protein
LEREFVMKIAVPPAPFRASAVVLSLAVAGLALPQAAQALCMASGAGCEAGAGGGRFLKPAKVTPKPYDVGDILPDEYLMLTNTGYYGLPPAQDGWVYFRVQHWLFRVDLRSRRILEDATYEANRAF